MVGGAGLPHPNFPGNDLAVGSMMALMLNFRISIWKGQNGIRNRTRQGNGKYCRFENGVGQRYLYWIGEVDKDRMGQLG